MTSPIVIQQPGFGDAIQKGLAPLIQALQFRQQQQQQQQQLKLQQEQLGLQQLSQRNTERERAINRGLDLAKMFGAGILEDPSVAAMFEQANINPKTVLKRFNDQQKAEQKAQDVSDQALIAGAPSFFQPQLKIAVQAFRSGVISKDDVYDFAKNLASSNPDPKLLETIAEEFPNLASLPPGDQVKAYADIQTAKAQVRAGVGAENNRQAQLQLSQARLQVSQARLALARATTSDEKLRSILAFTRIVDATLSDPLALVSRPELIGKGRDEQIRGLFGAAAAKQYSDAVKFLGAQVPEQP